MKVTVKCYAVVEFAREFDIDVDSVDEFAEAVERFERQVCRHSCSIDDLNNIQCKRSQVVLGERPRAYSPEFGRSMHFVDFIDQYLDRYDPIDPIDDSMQQTEEFGYWGQYTND